jgi:hypothetical protein
MHYRSWLIIWGISLAFTLAGQDRPAGAQFEDLGTNLWLGSYNKFRLSEKWFWRAEFHYRTGGYDGTPFIGRMSQIYNRHAINYIVNPNFNVALGTVLRLDFTPRPGDEAFEHVVPEPRIWHEYLFVMPFPRFQMFHRIRIEHRWSRRNDIGSDWIYRDRWRYKFYMTIPVNKPQLVPGAFFVNPDVEIIMQSGKPVVDSPMEDLRIYPSVGYIFSPSVTYTAGLMYTTGQRLTNGSVYRQRYVIRVNAYVSLDFRSEEVKIPAIKFRD